MGIAAFSGVLVGAASVNNLANADGKSIFLESKCQNCHSIESQGIKRTSEPKPGDVVPSDLSGAGLKHNASWITDWLNKEVELDGKKHLKKFKGSAGDLETLSTWLASQKKKH
jgi:mono/diheme cytochrome c family protein